MIYLCQADPPPAFRGRYKMRNYLGVFLLTTLLITFLTVTHAYAMRGNFQVRTNKITVDIGLDNNLSSPHCATAPWWARATHPRRILLPLEMTHPVPGEASAIISRIHPLIESISEVYDLEDESFKFLIWSRMLPKWDL
ncbi:hypothetical protein CEXT_368711 [Caerostris extrusa]|uniref:Uncharacterized protein n=1 Tax=Caerostris extrusa TaxID=172846 RepID=A0AAV4VJQ8_CAEEX|nr:hypothetical protein CEXT_368711 [Caerostris extrusa]